MFVFIYKWEIECYMTCSVSAGMAYMLSAIKDRWQYVQWICVAVLLSGQFGPSD